MLDRFQGDQGDRRLVDALKRQPVVDGDRDLAVTLSALVQLRQLSEGDVLIEEGGEDNDIHLLLSGELSIFVKGRQVATRKPGDHVGEMAMIDPSAPRSAQVLATGTCVVASLSEANFAEVASRHPQMWRALAIELGARLRERSKFHRQPNPRPVIFVGSSTEALPLARQIRSGLQYDDFEVRLWTEGVFGASRFPIDDLETQLDRSDFAILLLGPDDQVEARGTTHEAPRDNVIFELGLFMGELRRSRTLVVKPRGIELKIPTDLLGLTPVEYNPINGQDLEVSMGPVCDSIRQIVAEKGTK